MSTWTTMARHATYTGRLSSPKSASTARAASLVHRRGLAGGGADNHGTPKVNFWEDPLSPSKWKKEYFVIVPLAGCGLGTYAGYKFYTKYEMDKKRNEPPPRH